MKKVILGALLLLSTLTFGQKKHAGINQAKNGSEITTDSTKVSNSKWSKYIALGLSISNGNDYGDNANKYAFKESAYPNFEFGFSRENLSLSAVIGRNNFKGLGSNIDVFGDYYWELKVTPTFQLGVVNANIILGVGTYFNNQVGNGFIEYGSGISYTVGKFTYGVCYTNWDGIDYITPNISYGF
jgi:hypothetical protein